MLRSAVSATEKTLLSQHETGGLKLMRPKIEANAAFLKKAAKNF
jgi:hypothetical protein